MGVIEVLYLLNCGICITAYLPQLWKLVHDKTDSASVSIPSWLIWVYTGGIGLVYAVVINGDPLLILSAGSNMLLCGVIVGVLFFNRYFKSRIASGKDVSIYDLLKPAQNVILEMEPERGIAPVLDAHIIPDINDLEDSRFYS